MLDKTKRKDEKHEKGKFQKRNQRNSVYWVVVKKRFFVKMAFVRTIGKHYLCSEGKEKRIFIATICFGKMVLLSLCPFKVTNHYKNRGFSRHRGKPKMALLVAKVPFWEGASKGVLLSVIPKSRKHYFIVFSAKHSFADMKECNLKKTKLIKNKGLFANMQKGVFFWSVLFVFLVVLFFFLCFCACVL